MTNQLNDDDVERVAAMDRLRAASAGTPRWRYKGYSQPEDELVKVRVGDLRSTMTTRPAGGGSVVEAVDMAETRLLQFAIDGQAGRVPSDAREFERRVHCVFTELRSWGGLPKYSGFLAGTRSAGVEEVDGWRDISTAQRVEWPDTIIVAVETEYGWAMGLAYWGRHGPDGPGWKTADFNRRNQDLRLRHPTHWRPQLAPPAALPQKEPS